MCVLFHHFVLGSRECYRMDTVTVPAEADEVLASPGFFFLVKTGNNNPPHPNCHLSVKYKFRFEAYRKILPLSV